MKTIKFRAWDKKNKKMTFINDIKFNIDDGSINQVSTGFMEHGENEDDPGDLEDIVLLQYTGLIDKNNCKEVYEGDLITIEGGIGGNIYENEPRTSDIVIPQVGTKAWEATYEKAMERGLRYAE